MDDLKLFSKSEEQIDTLVRTVHVFSSCLGRSLEWKNMKFLPWRGGKHLDGGGIKLPNSEVMKEVEKEGQLN